MGKTTTTLRLHQVIAAAATIMIVVATISIAQISPQKLILPLISKATSLAPFSEVHVKSHKRFLDRREDAMEFAIALYNISIPHQVVSVSYEKSYDHRGYLEGTYFHAERSVVIAEPAYDSWAMLGSTLAHEIEIHGNQAFSMVWVMDRWQGSGTVIAEKVAYNYEISQHRRFGLSEKEVRLIKHIKEHALSDLRRKDIATTNEPVTAKTL